MLKYQENNGKILYDVSNPNLQKPECLIGTIGINELNQHLIRVLGFQQRWKFNV